VGRVWSSAGPSSWTPRAVFDECGASFTVLRVGTAVPVTALTCSILRATPRRRPRGAPPPLQS